MNGEMVEAVGEPEKTGWVYLRRPETGKPIYPIPEVKVPQDPSQKTWPTQPEPTMEPFSPIEASAGIGRKSRRSGRRRTTPKPKVVGIEDLHRRCRTDPNTINLAPNSAVGGDNWPPSSFDPEKNMYFVCSQAGALGRSSPPKPHRIQRRRNVHRLRHRSSPPASTPTGYLTAYDMSTGKIDWQNDIPANPATPAR